MIASGMFLFTMPDDVDSMSFDPRWDVDGNRTVVCNATLDQYLLGSIGDGEGGMIVVWVDYRLDDSADTYVQRLSADGTPLWGENGLLISDFDFDQEDSQIVSDGAGGAIVLWPGSSGLGDDLFAQRVGHNGDLLWGEEGLIVCGAEEGQLYAKMISDGSGGAIFTWGDTRDGGYDIYAQRIDGDGALLWEENGTAICTMFGDQARPEITSDGAGGAILTWRDTRYVASDIFTQRVNRSGEVQWTEDGVEICSGSGPHWYPKIFEDGSGGAVITWQDGRDGLNIYAQRVNATGAPLWGENGKAVCTASDDQVEPIVVVDSSGHSIIAWVDNREMDMDIYAQRMSPEGDILWEENGTVVCTAAESQGNVDMLADGSGGVFLVWSDYRAKSAKELYTQHVGPDGMMYWMENGINVLIGPNNLANPRLAEDGKGGIFIAWEGNDPISDRDIYARHIGMVITSTEPQAEFDEDSLPVFDMTSNEDWNATWSLTSDADCFWIDPQTGLVSGMPDNTHVGIHWINIHVENNEWMWDSLNFTVEVMNIPAVITTLEPITTVDQGDAYLFDLDSSDDGQGNVSWSLSTAGGWLTVNTTSGVLSGVPENQDVGESTVNVSVSDGNGGFDHLIFNITVNDTNDAPIITNYDYMNVTQDELFILALNATDVDLPGDVLTWNYTTSASWLGFNETTLLISGTPGNDDVGEHWINITVEDGRGGADAINITLIVENWNDAPTILTTELPMATIDILYTFELEAVDIDPTNDTLTWSISSNSSWLSINSTTGVLSGTPTEDDVGLEVIEITVSDGQGGEDIIFFSLSVLGVNEPPVIDPVSPQKGVVGETYLLELSATDINGDTMTWSIVTDADWLSINGTTGALSGMAVLGTFDVTVTVDDGRGGTDTMVLTIEIGPTVTADDDDDEGGDDTDDNAGMMPFIIMGILLLLIVVVVIIVLTRKGSSSDADEE
ncbi:MAG: hypothetical protein KAH57_02155 [Thermoplasmata archaeon]|nr:hypothetical protein [Thermoplasmata archaeon]